MMLFTLQEESKNDQLAGDNDHVKGSDADQKCIPSQLNSSNVVEAQHDVHSAKDPTLVINEKQSLKSSAGEVVLNSTIAPEYGGTSPAGCSMFSFGAALEKNNIPKVRC